MLLSTSLNGRSQVVWLMLSYRPEAARQASGLGYLPLHIALWYCDGYDDIILVLLEAFPAGARVEDPHGFFSGALLQDRFFFSLALVKKLMELFPGFAVEQDENGRYALHRGCFNTDIIEVIEYLIEHSPENILERQGNDGQLPLHCSAYDSHDEQVIELLISLYPQAVMTTNSSGKLPLHHACRNQHLGIFQSLIHHYQDPDAHCNGLAVADNEGRIPLHIAASKSRTFSEEESTELMQIMLDQYPEGVRVVDQNKRLPLHAACRARLVWRSDEFVLRRIQMMVDVDIFATLEVCNNGMSPLMYAFKSSLFHAIQLFLLEKQNEAL